ncbi:MAG TPA: iron ABC transporter permease [Acidimicrobiia bacterium]|nr:iron ABC transporter permease [Acidimicrobiia bacterium]
MAGRVVRNLRIAILWGVPLLFIGYLFVYPLLRILIESLTGEGFVQLVTRGRFLSSAWFTLWQAVVSTILTLIFSFPLTWALSRFNFRGKQLARALVTIPFVLPAVVVGASFLDLMPQGIMAILAAHVFYNVAVVVRTVGGVWSRIDPRVEDAAATLGASPGKVFRSVTLPLLRPAIASAAAIVFLFCFASFGTVLILGGGRIRTIEVEIYQQAVTFLNLPVAGALAVLQLLFVVASLLIANRLQRRIGIDLSAEVALPTPGPRHRFAVAAAVIVTLGLLSLPLVSLAVASLRRGGWRGLAGSQASAINPGQAIVNSLLYAVIATVIAAAIGLAAARVIDRRGGGWLDTALMLPLGVSAVTIGFGFLLALDQPFDLRGSFILVPLAHALVATPFVVRAALPLLRSIKPDLREAARVLGASPSRVWKEVDFPIISRALAVGAGLAAVVSLGEFGATSFVARPASVTVPTLIFRLLGRPGTVSYGTAMALAVILAAMTALLVLLVDRLRGNEAGTF